MQDGKCVGSLIIGPDGEIIHLSLYDNSQDQRQSDGDEEERGGSAAGRLSGECLGLAENSPCLTLSSPGCVCGRGEVALGHCPAARTYRYRSTNSVM